MALSRVEAQTMTFQAFALFGWAAVLGALFCLWVAQAQEAYLVKNQGSNANGAAVTGANFYAIQNAAIGGRGAAAAMALLGFGASVFQGVRTYMASRE